ncbi:MAG: MBL fold metallo-hydrolase, partial [Sphingomonadales bacterium]
MKKYILSGISVAIGLALIYPMSMLAKPHKVDGEYYAKGRIPQEIKDNIYPRSYFPGTEKIASDEMRVTALGTGMPTQTPSNYAAAFLVELGNGDSFLFDLGTGSTDNLAALEADYSKLDKVFASHLHTDHVGDVAALWVGGWLGGRYTPLHVYGPSGSSPELGIKAHIDHIRAAWAWDVTSRAGTLPNAGGEIVAHEFDFSKTTVIYDQNGVKITSFPAIHIRDGSVSFRLDWNGLSFV